mgnify:CR=1 FL=1
MAFQNQEPGHRQHVESGDGLVEPRAHPRRDEGLGQADDRTLVVLT